MVWEMVFSSLEKTFGVGMSSSGVVLSGILNEGAAVFGPCIRANENSCCVTWYTILELSGVEILTVSSTIC